MAQRFWHKATVQGAIVGGLALIIVVLIPLVFQVPKLRGDIETLRNALKAKDAEVQRLETLLTPFRTIALERYTGSEAEALSKLARRIQELELSLIAVRDYSEVAGLNPTGSHFSPGGVLKYTSPLTQLLEGTIIVSNGRLKFKTGKEVEENLLQVIEKFPRFPFAYYGMAYSLSQRGDPSWRLYALKAEGILEKTTTISGHKPSHDEVLKELREVLKKESNQRIESD